MRAPAWPLRSGLLAATLLAAAAAPADAANRDLDQGWLLPPRATAALCAGRCAATSPGRAWAMIGTGRLYGMAELPLAQAAAGFAAGGLGVSLDWHRLGAGLYVEDRLRLALRLHGDPGLEVAGGWDSVRIGGDATRRAAVEIRGGLALAAGTRLCVRQVLTAPPPWHAVGGRYAWAFLHWADGARAASLALDRETDGPLRLQAEVWTKLASGLAVGWRVDPATGTIGWVTGLTSGRLLLRSSHLVHPELGVSHRWQLGIGSAGAAP